MNQDYYPINPCDNDFVRKYAKGYNDGCTKEELVKLLTKIYYDEINPREYDYTELHESHEELVNKLEVLRDLVNGNY